MSLVISKNRLIRIFIFSLIFCSILISYFYIMPATQNISPIFQIIKYGIFIVIPIYYMICGKKTKIIIFISIYCIYNIFITIMNWGLEINWLGLMISVIEICMLFDTICKSKKLYILEDFTFTCNIFVFINLLVMIFIPEGIIYSTTGKFYFFGFDNGMIVILFPVLCFNLIINYIKAGKIKLNIACWINIISIALSGSSTSLVGLGIIAVLYIAYLVYIKKKQKEISLYKFLFVSICIFISIVLLRMQYIFEWFINNVLKRDTTFTARTAIWNVAIERFKENPLFGCGQNSDYQRSVYYGVSNAHNLVLDILTQSGIIGLILFSLILLSVSSSLYKYKHCAISIILTIFIGAFFIIMQFESYCAYDAYPLIFCLFVMASNLQEFDSMSVRGRYKNG